MSERRPQVTIGLPVFNGERFLRQALSSNLEQTFEDLELIVCDNASTDGTLEIVQEFAARDARVRLHRHPQNLGAAGNYNSTVELARGRYFRWTTHDDVVAPTHLERLVQAFEQGPPSMALAYPKTTIIDAEGQVVGDFEDRIDTRASEPHQRLRVLFRNLTLCNAVLGLTRTDTLRRTGLIGSFRASDKVLLYELAMAGEIVEVPERLFLRRRDEVLASPSNLSAAEQAAWFNPAATESRYRWTLARQSFAALGRAPMGFYQRQRCRLALLRETVRWRRQLWAELRAGAPA